MQRDLAEDTTDLTAPSHADAIIALSFGTGGSGTANQALAEVAAQYSRSRHLPVICQKEVAEYLRKDDKTGQVLTIPQAPESNIDTYDALLSAKNEFCDSRGWNDIILVAHPDHVARAAAAAERLGFRVTAAKVGEVPYDRNSAQWRARNKYQFAIWERIATLYYRATGRI